MEARIQQRLDIDRGQRERRVAAGRCAGELHSMIHVLVRR